MKIAAHDTESSAVQRSLPRVSEEPLAWTDEGVQFIGDQIPARLLRRISLERHFSEDGTEVQVPREDVIVVPLVMN